MENEKQIVYVEQLSLTIGKETLLKDINVTFEQGKIYGIIGRNGSGKTLLFKCICGYIKPTTGHVFVNGKEIHKDIDFPRTCSSNYGRSHPSCSRRAYEWTR